MNTCICERFADKKRSSRDVKVCKKTESAQISVILDCNHVAISEVTFFLLVSELSKEFWFVIRLSYAKQCI